MKEFNLNFNKNILMEKKFEVSMSKFQSDNFWKDNVINMKLLIEKTLNQEFDTQLIKNILLEFNKINHIDYMDGINDKQNHNLLNYIYNSEYENFLISDPILLGVIYDNVNCELHKNLNLNNNINKYGTIFNKNIFYYNGINHNKIYFYNDNSVNVNYENEIIQNENFVLKSKYGIKINNSKTLHYFTEVNNKYIAWSREQLIKDILE